MIDYIMAIATVILISLIVAIMEIREERKKDKHLIHSLIWSEKK